MLWSSSSVADRPSLDEEIKLSVNVVLLSVIIAKLMLKKEYTIFRTYIHTDDFM